MTAATIRRAAGFLAGLGLAAATLAGAPILPSYSRAITSPFFGRIDEIVVAMDFNGDGWQDILVGGDGRFGSSCLVPPNRPLPAPMRVLISKGDGTFRDGTSEVVDRGPDSFFNPVQPRGVIADFNNDGRPDIAVFEGGVECGRFPEHTYIGSPPILLLSGADGKWLVSTALSDAIATFHAERMPQFGPYLHVLWASAGDINSDGRVDLWVESSGAQNLGSPFLMNQADGTFTVDINRLPSNVMHNPPPEFWRHWGNALADLDDDGRLDIVMGQIRDNDPTHINESSIVVFNDGRGNFPLSNRRLLPPPDFAGGMTGVNALIATDVDGDGRTDLIVTHHRTLTTEFPDTGRYVQILINRGGRQFVDDTLARMGDQSATAAPRSPLYAPNLLRNQVYRVFAVDVDGDGTTDLAMNAAAPIGWESPLVHLNDGTGLFRVMDPDIFTNRELFFGENSVPLDLNGDGVVDFVHSDALPGTDGRYNTDDDVTRIIALIGTLPN